MKHGGSSAQDASPLLGLEGLNAKRLLISIISAPGVKYSPCVVVSFLFFFF